MWLSPLLLSFSVITILVRLILRLSMYEICLVFDTYWCDSSYWYILQSSYEIMRLTIPNISKDWRSQQTFFVPLCEHISCLPFHGARCLLLSVFSPPDQNFGLDYHTFQHMVGDCPPDFLQLAFNCCNVSPSSASVHVLYPSTVCLWSSWRTATDGGPIFCCESTSVTVMCS